MTYFNEKPPSFVLGVGKGSKERNICEDSTLPHLQKKPGVKLGKHIPSFADQTIKQAAKGVRHLEDDHFPRIQDAYGPRHLRARGQYNFLIEADRVSS